MATVMKITQCGSRPRRENGGTRTEEKRSRVGTILQQLYSKEHRFACTPPDEVFRMEKGKLQH